MSERGPISTKSPPAICAITAAIITWSVGGCHYEGLDQQVRQQRAEQAEKAEADKAQSPPEQPPRAPQADPPAAGAASAPAAPAYPIELSLGVALPQTLPTGTAMGFSVEYAFARGGPDPSWKYAVAAQSAGGRQAFNDVRLSERGTLQWFVSWKPGDGPFHARIVGQGPDGSQRQLSDVIELRE